MTDDPRPSPPVPPLSGPLQVDTLLLQPAGRLAMTHCPGRSTRDGRGRALRRDLQQDVEAIHAAGFGTVLSLLSDDELAALGAAGLGAALQRAGLQWRQFPIQDFGVPGPQALPAWRKLQHELLAQLRAGEGVLVHCAAGLGRTGTMVAALLKALGDEGATAIARVRQARPGTIETAAQEAFVKAFEP